MADRQSRKAGFSLPGGRRLGTSGLEPSLTILYLCILALWVLLMSHFNVPLDAPLLVPLPGNSMLPSPVLTCVVAIASAGVGISYVNRRQGPMRLVPLLITIVLPTALTLLPYQWLYSRDGCWGSLVAALTTGVMMFAIGLPNRWAPREAAARAVVAAAFVACVAMPWLATRRGDAAFWTFGPENLPATTTEADVTRAANDLISSWEGTAISDRGRLCEDYLMEALALYGLDGETIVVKPGPAASVVRNGGDVTVSVATMAAPDVDAVLDGLDGAVAKAAAAERDASQEQVRERLADLHAGAEG